MMYTCFAVLLKSTFAIYYFCVSRTCIRIGAVGIQLNVVRLPYSYLPTLQKALLVQLLFLQLYTHILDVSVYFCIQTEYTKSPQAYEFVSICAVKGFTFKYLFCGHVDVFVYLLFSFSGRIWYMYNDTECHVCVLCSSSAHNNVHFMDLFHLFMLFAVKLPKFTFVF